MGSFRRGRRVPTPSIASHPANWLANHGHGGGLHPAAQHVAAAANWLQLAPVGPWIHEISASNTNRRAVSRCEHASPARTRTVMPDDHRNQPETPPEESAAASRPHSEDRPHTGGRHRAPGPPLEHLAGLWGITPARRLDVQPGHPPVPLVRVPVPGPGPAGDSAGLFAGLTPPLAALLLLSYTNSGDVVVDVTSDRAVEGTARAGGRDYHSLDRTELAAVRRSQTACPSDPRALADRVRGGQHVFCTGTGAAVGRVPSSAALPRACAGRRHRDLQRRSVQRRRTGRDRRDGQRT